MASKSVKLSTKIILDVLMFVALILLYRAKVLTLTYHEVVGLGILLVFLVHCLFNRNWVVASTKKLFSPFTPARTKFSYWLSVALVVSFIIIAVSGIFISKVLFREQIEGLALDTSLFRTLHLFFSAVSLILVGMHLGLYWGIVKGFFKKKIPALASAPKALCYVALAAVVAFGVYSVPTSGFGSWLLCPVVPIQHHGHGDQGEEGAEPGQAQEQDGQAGQGRQPKVDDAQHADGDQPSDQGQQQERGQKGGNHGNNIEAGNIVLTIAQYSSIVGLFAAITYYVNEWLRRRKAGKR